MPVPRLRPRPLRLSCRPGSPAGLLRGPSGRWRRLLPARKNLRRWLRLGRRLLLTNRRLRLGQCLLQKNRHLLPSGRGPKSRPIPTARQRLNHRNRALQNSRCP
jgi:hypothetical protein